MWDGPSSAPLSPPRPAHVRLCGPRAGARPAHSVMEGPLVSVNAWLVGAHPLYPPACGRPSARQPQFRAISVPRRRGVSRLPLSRGPSCGRASVQGRCHQLCRVRGRPSGGPPCGAVSRAPTGASPQGHPRAGVRRPRSRHRRGTPCCRCRWSTFCPPPSSFAVLGAPPGRLRPTPRLRGAGSHFARRLGSPSRAPWPPRPPRHLAVTEPVGVSVVDHHHKPGVNPDGRAVTTTRPTKPPLRPPRPLSTECPRQHMGRGVEGLASNEPLAGEDFRRVAREDALPPPSVGRSWRASPFLDCLGRGRGRWRATRVPPLEHSFPPLLGAGTWRTSIGVAAACRQL